MKLTISEQNIKDHRQEICSQLRQRRKELGLSPGDLAENMGITAAAVLKIENGEWDFKFSFLTAFAAALDLEIDIKPKRSTNWIRVADFNLEDNTYYHAIRYGIHL